MATMNLVLVFCLAVVMNNVVTMKCAWDNDQKGVNNAVEAAADPSNNEKLDKNQIPPFTIPLPIPIPLFFPRYSLPGLPLPVPFFMPGRPFTFPTSDTDNMPAPPPASAAHIDNYNIPRAAVPSPPN